MKRPNRATRFLQDAEFVQLGDQERGVYAAVVLLISQDYSQDETAYDASAQACRVTT